MKKPRLLLVLLFLSELITATMHLTLFIFDEIEFPLELYFVIPLIVTVSTLISFLINTILDWIIGIKN